LAVYASLFVMALAVVAFSCFSSARAESHAIVCASTTSTQNTGLFEYLLPLFTADTGVEVKVIAVGTGQALAMAARGDADALVVHAPSAEKAFIAEGHGLDRREFMYNDFVIVGPPSDPAGIRGERVASEAFRKIADKKALFISRGDDSGTHKKEMSIWKSAGIEPGQSSWYLESGQGMSNTVRIADERKAYTLSDRGTWLATKARLNPELEVMVEGDPVFKNQYSVIVVNPQKHPHANSADAQKFSDWLVSEKGQRIIGDFKDKYGNTLFHPNAR